MANPREAGEALASLQQAFQKREPDPIYVKSEPAFYRLHVNPRFRALTLRSSSLKEKPLSTWQYHAHLVERRTGILSQFGGSLGWQVYNASGRATAEKGSVANAA
jgi:hypothetical protein